MKMKPYRVCDTCGRLMERNSENRVVIKRRYVWAAWDWVETGYTKIDLCADCQEKMFEWIKEERSKR